MPFRVVHIGEAVIEDQIHACTGRQADHPRSTASTRCKACSSTCASIRTAVPSANTISIRPDGWAVGLASNCGTGDDASMLLAHALRDVHSKELHNAYEVRYAFVVGTALAVMPSAEDPFLISTSSIF
jgi:hypothetical protein